MVFSFLLDTWHILSQSFFCWSRPRTNSVHSWEILMGFGTVICWLSVRPKEGLTPCLCPSCNRWCHQAFDQNVTFVHLLLNFCMTCSSPWILPNFTYHQTPRCLCNLSCLFAHPDFLLLIAAPHWRLYSPFRRGSILASSCY